MNICPGILFPGDAELEIMLAEIIDDLGGFTE